MMNSRANVRPFNAHVLIGNWFEDRVMEEVDILKCDEKKPRLFFSLII